MNGHPCHTFAGRDQSNAQSSIASLSMVLPRQGCSECVRFQRCRSILLRADPPGAIAVMAALVDRCTVNGEEVVPAARRHLRCLDNQPDHILVMRRGRRVPVAAWVCDYDVVVLGCGVR